jgi:hypothetical protein
MSKRIGPLDSGRLTPSVQRCQRGQVLQPLEGSRCASTSGTQERQETDDPADDDAYPGNTLLRQLGEEFRGLVLEGERVEGSA